MQVNSAGIIAQSQAFSSVETGRMIITDTIGKSTVIEVDPNQAEDRISLTLPDNVATVNDVLTATGANSMTWQPAAIDQSTIDHLVIQNRGIVTHATIDSFLNQPVQSASTPTFSTVTVALAPVADSELANKKYVDDSISGVGVIHEEVLDFLANPPATTLGDRYVIIATATGAWTGLEDQIAEGTGGGWNFTVPALNDRVFRANNTTLYQYNGTDWVIIINGIDFDTISPIDAKGDLIVGVGGITSTNLAIGVDGSLLTADSTQAEGVRWDTRDEFDPFSWSFARVETSGTSGGQLASGGWQTRIFNFSDPNNSSQFVTRTGNVFTIEDGSYHVEASVAVAEVNGNRLRWENTTDATTAAVGATTSVPNNTSIIATLLGNFVVTGGPKDFELQHIVSRTRSDGRGFSAGISGIDEIYCGLIIEQIHA